MKKQGAHGRSSAQCEAATTMRIEVTARGSEFEDQTRAYAEFRVFSTLARFSEVVEHASITLRRASADRHAVLCVVGVTLACGTRARISARGRHAYDAIDRAAGRVADVLRRRARVAVTP